MTIVCTVPFRISISNHLVYIHPTHRTTHTYSLKGSYSGGYSSSSSSYGTYGSGAAAMSYYSATYGSRYSTFTKTDYEIDTPMGVYDLSPIVGYNPERHVPERNPERAVFAT